MGVTNRFKCTYKIMFTGSVVTPDPVAPLEATWRFSVADSEEFDHLGNPDHVIISRDPQLGSNVVELKNVCWLNFRKKLGVHVAGTYQV